MSLSQTRKWPLISLSLLAIVGGSALAAPTKSAVSQPRLGTPSSGGTTSNTSTVSTGSSLTDYIGMNYFTFWSGPGLGADFYKSPSTSGRNDPDWMLWTNLSVRAKFSKNLAFDAQFRLQQFLTNEFRFLYQGVRLGVSGALLRLERPGYKLVWSGAVNTEMPGLGQLATQRKLIANPGMFTSLTFRPTGSRFSLFALVSPRVWFYSDRVAMDEVSLSQGSRPGEKPQAVIALSPSINYDLTEKTALRTGVGLNFQKNMNADSFRRWFLPVDFGVTHRFNSMLSIYPNVSFSGPWDDQLRKDLGAFPGSKWTDTISLGMWLNGTLF